MLADTHATISYWVATGCTRLVIYHSSDTDSVTVPWVWNSVTEGSDIYLGDRSTLYHLYITSQILHCCFGLSLSAAVYEATALNNPLKLVPKKGSSAIQTHNYYPADVNKVSRPCLFRMEGARLSSEGFAYARQYNLSSTTKLRRSAESTVGKFCDSP
jgi:hypothetical protein